MIEFVVLRPKMYAYKKTEKKLKDTKNNVAAKRLTFDNYKSCLSDGKTLYKEQMLLKNKKHKVYTIKKHMIALNRDDNKRGLWK